MKIKVAIEPHDTWSMDQTLSHIIVPMLKQLKATKQGSPYVDDCDLPEHLQSTAGKPKENDWDLSKFHHEAWDWIMNEMIWAMEQIRDDSNSPIYQEPYDREAVLQYDERIKRGCLFFGKYFQCLWD